MGIFKKGLRRFSGNKNNETTGTLSESLSEDFANLVIDKGPQVRTVWSHKDDFEMVTKATKRMSRRYVSAPFTTSVSSSSPDTSLAESFDEDSLIRFKHGATKHQPQQHFESSASQCGSIDNAYSSSPSLSYSASLSSENSSISWRSDFSWQRKESVINRHEPGLKQQQPRQRINAGIPPLLPAHRTFDSPYHGSFHKRPIHHRHSRSVAASDFIPATVFTRKCAAEPRKTVNNATKMPAKLPATSKPKDDPASRRFSLNGYQEGTSLQVVNMSPPGSPHDDYDFEFFEPEAQPIKSRSEIFQVVAEHPLPPPHQSTVHTPEPGRYRRNFCEPTYTNVSVAKTRPPKCTQSAPVRYRVPSKAAILEKEEHRYRIVT